MKLFAKKGASDATELNQGGKKTALANLGLKTQGMERSAAWNGSNPRERDLSKVQWGEVEANPVNEPKPQVEANPVNEPTPLELEPEEPTETVKEPTAVPRQRASSRAQKRQLSEKRALENKLEANDLMLSAVQMYPEQSVEAHRMSTHPVSKPNFKSMSSMPWKQSAFTSDPVWKKRQGFIQNQGRCPSTTPEYNPRPTPER
jgi:hypothetical protein